MQLRLAFKKERTTLNVRMHGYLARTFD